MSTCKKRGDEIPKGKGEILRHMWEKHPDEARATLKKAKDAAAEQQRTEREIRDASRRGAALRAFNKETAIHMPANTEPKVPIQISVLITINKV